MQKYKVIRHHEGDKPYAPGDVREAEPADVAHLIGRCLEPFVSEGAAAVKATGKGKGAADAKAAADGPAAADARAAADAKAAADGPAAADAQAAADAKAAAGAA